MNRLLFLLSSAFLLLLSACGSAETAMNVDAEPAPKPILTAPSFDVLKTTGTELVLTTDLANATSSVIGKGGEIVFQSFSPSGEYVGIGVANTTESNLYLMNRSTRSVSKLFSGSKGLVFSGQWTASGTTFYYGQYQPDGNRMGAGSIHSFNTATNTNSKVPCSASRFVLSVLPAGSLLVRNSDSIYEVATSDCATIKTIDARKMYSVSVSPDGQKMAYILRDLVFNRTKRTYEPDSTLFVTTLGSSAEPVKVIGDKYQPRNMAWSPDGSELAYDVIAQDGSKKRAISIYSIASAGSAYLEPPQSTLRSNTQPQYSPDGNHILFKSASPANEVELKWKTSGQQFSQTVPVFAENPFSHWNWVGKDLLFVKDTTGESGLFNVSGASGSMIWTGTKDVVLSLPVR